MINLSDVNIEKIKNFALKYKYRKDAVLVVGQSLLKPLSKLKPKIDVKVRIINNIDGLKHVIEHHGSWYVSWAQKRLEEGNLCFGADYNGKIISTVWTSFEEVFLPDVEFTLKAKNGVIPLLGAWTSPDFRGQGIYPSVWNECCKFLIKEKHAKRVWGFIHPSNISSFRVHRDLHCDTIDMVIILNKFLGIKKHRIICPFRPVEKLINLDNASVAIQRELNELLRLGYIEIVQENPIIYRSTKIRNKNNK